MTNFDIQLKNKNIPHTNINASDWDFIYSIGGWEGEGSGGGSLLQNNIEFLNFLNSLKVSSILDLGCGDLQYITHLDNFNNIKYTGVDGSKVNVSKIQHRANIIHDDILTFRTDIVYDLVLCKDVVQHIVGDKNKLHQLLETIRSVRSNIKLIVTDNHLIDHFKRENTVFSYKCGHDLKVVVSV